MRGLLLAIIYVACLAYLCAATTHSDSSSQIQQNSFEFEGALRERRPLFRGIASHESLLRVGRRVVPKSPPLLRTNAHSGVDESTRVQSRQRSTSRDSFNRNIKPSSANLITVKTRPASRLQQVMQGTSSPVRKSGRRLRRRRPATRREVEVTAAGSEPKINHRFARKIVEGALTNVIGGARLIGASGNYGYVPLVNKLIDNATLIRQNIVEGFDCRGKTYGYYADQLNACQIFHICVPMKQIFPDHFTENDVYHFSFICPQFTIFSQDAMVCAWEGSAVPCAEAHNLYHMNQNFFVVSNDVQKEKTTPKPIVGGYFPAGSSGPSRAPYPQQTAPAPSGSYPTPNGPSPPPAAYPAPGGAPPARPQIQPQPYPVGTVQSRSPVSKPAKQEEDKKETTSPPTLNSQTDGEYTTTEENKTVNTETVFDNTTPTIEPDKDSIQTSKNSTTEINN